MLIFSFWLAFAPQIASSAKYRVLAQENLWYLQLETGTVVIELNPQFAPNTVQQIKSLSRAGAYNNTPFYRVIDGFVAQAGPGDSPLSASVKAALGSNDVPLLGLEGRTEWGNSQPYTLVQSPDLFAAKTTFVNGFAVGLNEAGSKAWLLHCPGAVGMARGNAANSATSDFYIVIGQAPRYLDGIMTLFGRVVWGMDRVQAILRASPLGSGVLTPEEPKTHILRAIIGSDLPLSERMVLAVEKTDSDEFKEKLKARKRRDHPFFFERPPAVLDVCQVPISIRLESTADTQGQ